MIGPPCLHTHVVPLVSNLTVYRVSVIRVSSSSMRIMHVAPSTLVRPSVNTDHCFVQVLCRSDYSPSIKCAGNLCLHRIQGPSETYNRCLPISSSISYVSGGLQKSALLASSRHYLGILSFLTGRVRGEEKRTCLSRRPALASSLYRKMPTILASDSTSYGNQNHDDLLAHEVQQQGSTVACVAIWQRG